MTEPAAIAVSPSKDAGDLNRAAHQLYTGYAYFEAATQPRKGVERKRS